MGDNGNDKETKELTEQEEREQRFIQNLALGMNIKEAALNAGYSKSTANSSVYQKFYSPNFLNKLQEYVKSIPEARAELAKVRLPKLFQLEDKFYQKCSKDPELYAKYSKISERDYKLAGLLKEEVKAQVIVPIQVAVQLQNVLSEQQNVSQVDSDTVTIENDKSDQDDDGE